MPSSTLRHLGNQPGQPVMQPAFNPSYRADEIVVSPFSYGAVGDDWAGMTSVAYGSQTYPAASRAIAYPFEIGDYLLARLVWWMNGTTVGTDSADVGIYTEAGGLLVSGGGTVIAGANAIQSVDTTDTLLAPGRYWCAYAQNGTTATPCGISSAAPSRASGCAQMAAAYVLPATFTPAAAASPILPVFGFAARTLI